MTLKELSRRRFIKSASGLLLVPAFDILVPKLKATSFFAAAAAGGGANDVTFDNSVESAEFSTATPFTFNITPVGTARGLLVLITHQNVATDLISGVRVNPAGANIALTEVPETGVDTAGEAGAAYAYFLGSGIPSGELVIEITTTGGTELKHAVAITVTANGDTSIQAVDGVGYDSLSDTQQANPQIALNTGATESLRFCALFSGRIEADPVVIASTTVMHSHDYLALRSAHYGRQTTRASGSVTVGYTTPADDVAMVAVAIQ